jgi:hypothetical protein
MANTTTGVTTLKQLNKECLNIDLTKVRLKKGEKPQSRWRDEYVPNEPLPLEAFNLNMKGENPNLMFCDYGGIRQITEFWKHSTGNWDYLSSTSNEGIDFCDCATYRIMGGKHGRPSWTNPTHYTFTDATILINDQDNEILGVLYALDNDYLNEWLRQTIDPNIPNNYDELRAEKEFEVLITTTTFSTEKVEVVGRSYDECLETMKQNDPMLGVGWDMGNLFSGMKTTFKKEGAKPIPSSYEEWVSLNEKEVA